MNAPHADRAIDPARCPLCGQPNRCAMEVQRESGTPQPPCWCGTVRFAPALREQVPAKARQLACICQACATRDTRP